MYFQTITKVIAIIAITWIENALFLRSTSAQGTPISHPREICSFDVTNGDQSLSIDKDSNFGDSACVVYIEDKNYDKKEHNVTLKHDPESQNGRLRLWLKVSGGTVKNIKNTLLNALYISLNMML
jgi:hypothetical protein